MKFLLNNNEIKLNKKRTYKLFSSQTVRILVET